jgi:hypothetical protein
VGQLGDLTMGPMASPEAFAEFARAHGWRVRIAPGRSAVGGVSTVTLYDGAAPTLETYWLDPAAGRAIRHFGCRYEAAGGRYATPAEQLRIVATGPTRLPSGGSPSSAPQRGIGYAPTGHEDPQAGFVIPDRIGAYTLPVSHLMRYST